MNQVRTSRFKDVGHRSGRMRRPRSAGVILAAMMLMLVSSCRTLSALPKHQFLGCYRIDAGPAHASRVVRLTSTPAADLLDDGESRDVFRDLALFYGHERRSGFLESGAMEVSQLCSWFVDDDVLHLSWGNGFGGSVLRLTGTLSELNGEIAFYGDVYREDSGFEIGVRLPVQVQKVPCTGDLAWPPSNPNEAAGLVISGSQTSSVPSSDPGGGSDPN